MITLNLEKKTLVEKLLQDKTITIDQAFMLLEEVDPVHISYPSYIYPPYIIPAPIVNPYNPYYPFTISSIPGTITLGCISTTSSTSTGDLN